MPGKEFKMKYQINIIETSSRLVEIEAKDKDTALQLVKDKWNRAEIVLDADDFTEVVFV